LIGSDQVCFLFYLLVGKKSLVHSQFLLDAGVGGEFRVKGELFGLKVSLVVSEGLLVQPGFQILLHDTLILESNSTRSLWYIGKP
jgi:hypothetical protein